MSNVAPYGSWKSPITSELLVQQGGRLLELFASGEEAFWTESRPLEKGRYALVSSKRGDVLPSSYNARTRVHEYGGKAALVHNGILYFCNFADQFLYKISLPSSEQQQEQQQVPEATLVTNLKGCRYADAVFDERHNQIICVREDHSIPNKEATSTIVGIDLVTGEQKVLAQSADFYAAPRLSNDGTKLAYIQWNHPWMPFDNTALYVQALDPETGAAQGSPVKLAGNGNEAILQCSWNPFDTTDPYLYFVSDRSDGWWNIHRVDMATNSIELVLSKPHEAEFAVPAWNFGQQNYVFLDKDTILATFGEKSGGCKLATISISNKTMSYIPSDYSSISDLHVNQSRTKAYFLGGSYIKAKTVVELDLKTKEFKELYTGMDVAKLPFEASKYFSRAEQVEFPTTGGRTAYGYLYKPFNSEFKAPEGELPPLLVKLHGGPTANTSTVLSLAIQYWTTRGFAVFDVDYRGSTGYGRDYRQQLTGAWGVADVEDCCNGANYLSKQGLADENRLCISGGSAGGFTVLACLAKSSVFKAGASHYGICDLEMLAHDTHKFEARYLDNLIGGPYSTHRHVYIERSPITNIASFTNPLVIFQGDEDQIVPPNQAEKVYLALKEKGIPVAYILFAGEQHGFRKAENIKAALDGEFFFYSKIFKFEPAEQLQGFKIDNL